mmetsp:Transcript_33564/g.67786  ORF Transcript_33564/g.67786 Transcript_33564/m.67786 type:complete len:325 (-) Transcript_33564:730-1704(-)
MTNTSDPPEFKGPPAVQPEEEEDALSIRRLSNCSGDLTPTEHQFPASPVTPRRRLRNLDGKMLVPRPPVKREPVDPPEYTEEMALVSFEETKLVLSDPNHSAETRNNNDPVEIKGEAVTAQEETKIVLSNCPSNSGTTKLDDTGDTDPAMSRSNSRGSEKSSKQNQLTTSNKSERPKEVSVAVSPDGDNDFPTAMVPFKPSPASEIPSSQKPAEDDAFEKTHNQVSGQKLIKRSNSKGLSRSNSKGVNRSNSKGKTERRSSKNDCAEKRSERVGAALVTTGRVGGALVVRKKSSNSSSSRMNQNRLIPEISSCVREIPGKMQRI